MAERSNLPLKIRISGWGLVLGGGTCVLLSGGYSPEQPVLFVTGTFLMIGGMILTSVSSLLSQLRRRKELLEKAEAFAREARGGPPDLLK